MAALLLPSFQFLCFFFLQSLKNMWRWFRPINHVLALRNVPISYVWSIPPISILAFHIVFIRGRWSDGDFRDIASLLLNFLDESGHLNGFDQILMLPPPFSFLIIFRYGFVLLRDFSGFCLFMASHHAINCSFILTVEHSPFFRSISRFLVDGQPIRIKFSATIISLNSIIDSKIIEWFHLMGRLIIPFLVQS
jgi:hypothetical protein